MTKVTLSRQNVTADGKIQVFTIINSIFIEVKHWDLFSGDFVFCHPCHLFLSPLSSLSFRPPLCHHFVKLGHSSIVHFY